MENTAVYESVLRQWEKLTGAPCYSEEQKNECFACFHESSVCLALAKMERKKAMQTKGA